jgi:hypothetical protein
MVEAAEIPNDPPKSAPMPKVLLAFPLGYIALLIVALIFWNRIGSFKLLGLIPLLVVWMGAAGGVVSSLQGIFFHNKSWDDSYNYWHMLSSMVGAIYGIFSYLFLLVVIKSATDSVPSSAPIFALGAFTLGYGQQQFHSLMMKAFDLIFQPHDKTKNAEKD